MRGHIRRSAAFALAGVTLALTTAGCLGGGDDDASRTGSGTLVMLDTSIAPSLDNDGVAAADPALQQGIENLREPLLRYPTTERDGILVPNYKVTPEEYEPALAESWTRKGLTWTFKLRKGVKSCAGNTFTADDVIYTFARAKSVSGASPVAWFLGNVSNLFDLSAVDPKATSADRELKGEVTKVDDYTVRFKQLAPNDLFPRVLEIFPFYIFDSKAMKENATAADPWSHKYNDTRDSPGFGPYCLEKWSKGREMTFTANPGYWQGKPAYGRVVLRQVPSNSDRLGAISAGQANVVTALTPKEFERVDKSGRASVLSWQNNRILGLGINSAYAPFDDAEKGRLIRQAIAYTLPYDDIINTDYLGQAKKWNGLVESTYYGFKEDARYDTDLAKAKQLMAQAGYPDGQGLPSDSQAFALNYVAERATLLEPIANRIKTALGQIGIPVRLEPISQSEENTRELTKLDMGMFLRDYNRPLGPDVGYAALLWYVSKEKGGLVNSTRYRNDELDAIFAKSQTAAGEERLKLLGQLQDILMEDLPVVPIAEVPSQLALSKGLGNWRGQTYDLVNFWYLRPSGQE